MRQKRNITSMSGVQSPFIPRSSTLALIARRTCNQDSLVEIKPDRAFFTQAKLTLPNFSHENIKSNQIRSNFEPCDLTEFSTSLEYFGVVKFRPNYSSNHSASLAYHLDSCCSLKFRLQQLWRCSLYRLEFVLNLTPFLSLVCAK